MLMDKPVSKFTGKNSGESVFHLNSHKNSEVSKSVFVNSLDQKGTFSLKTVAFNRRKNNTYSSLNGKWYQEIFTLFIKIIGIRF